MSLLVAVVACCGSLRAAEPERAAWKAHNMAGNCEMIWGAKALGGSEPLHVLTVQVLSNPQDKTALHQGQTMFSLAVFDSEGAMKTEEVESFSILGRESDLIGTFTVQPIASQHLSFVLGDEAEAALEFLRVERFVRVRYKTGQTATFRVANTGYTPSRAMFDACTAALRKNA